MGIGTNCFTINSAPTRTLGRHTNHVGCGCCVLFTSRMIDGANSAKTELALFGCLINVHTHNYNDIENLKTLKTKRTTKTKQKGRTSTTAHRLNPVQWSKWRIYHVSIAWLSIARRSAIKRINSLAGTVSSDQSSGKSTFNASVWCFLPKNVPHICIRLDAYYLISHIPSNHSHFNLFYHHFESWNCHTHHQRRINDLSLSELTTTFRSRP